MAKVDDVLEYDVEETKEKSFLQNWHLHSRKLGSVFFSPLQEKNPEFAKQCCSMRKISFPK